MTSQKDQIQTLITEIDGVLQRANPRLPWVMSGEVTQQRRVLERVRNYLVSLQQQQALNRGYGVAPGTDFLSQDLYYQPSQDPTRSPAFESDNSADPSTKQMLDRVLQEIAQLKGSLAPSNQPPLNTEVVQVLINRLQERLSQQIAQAFQPVGGQTLQPPRSDYMLAAGTAPAPLSAYQYEQLQVLRTRSDQMLVNLDSTLNIVFESLQRNIQTYQDSLSQGLDRMYSLGQQSEVTFKALVELLIKQLQQEIATVPAVPSPVPASPPSPLPAVPTFPYAGAEIRPTDLSQVDLTPAPQSPQPSSVVEPPTNDALFAWLNLTGAQNQSIKPIETPPVSGSIPTLDLSNLELGVAQSSSTSSAPAPQEVVETLAGFTNHEEDTTEIDAALKLLENLSAELQTTTSPVSLEDAEYQLDSLLGEASVGEAETFSLPEIPQNQSTELDDFYQSLFGESETTTASGLPPIPTPESAPINFPGVEFPAASEEIFLDNLFEETPTLPPLPSSEGLLTDLFDLEESPTKPDLENLAPEAIAPAEVRFTRLDQISSLVDLFETVPIGQEHSTPVEPPASRATEPAAETPALIEVPFEQTFEQTYGELLRQDTSQPLEQPAQVEQNFWVADDFLEEEQYTRAAFDENLLPDAPAETVNLTLEVDEVTLKSLNEDLASLENLGYESQYYSDAQPAIASPTPPQSAPSAPTLDEFATALFNTDTPSESFSGETIETAFTLNDFATDLSSNSVAEPPAAQSEELSPGDSTTPFTLEGMDDLFEDAPPLNPPAASHPPSATRPTPSSQTAAAEIGLDEAFESLLGPIASPFSTEATYPTSPSNSEKKKT